MVDEGSRPPRPKLRRLGWREWLALPDLGVTAVKAKVDTGARSSALHAYEVTTFERDGQPRVRFVLHPIQRDNATTVEAEAPLVEERWVRNSGGGRELRPMIVTPVTWAGETWAIEVTLTNRDVMGFRMLLGRQAIRGRFLVDPGRSFRGGKPPLDVRRPHRKGAT